MLLSIVIPVYNVEQYLHKCIDSVVNQSGNIQIILVDDGSTDKSGAICDEYAEKYGCIKVVHQKNKGLSAARNVGLRLAEGDYVNFLDSDDYVSSDFYEKICAIINDYSPDCIMFNGVRVGNGKQIKLSGLQSTGMISGEEFIVLKIRESELWAPVVLYCYKKDLLLTENLQFKEGILSEDEQFTPRALVRCKRCVYIDECLYFYVYRVGSITVTKNIERIKKRYKDTVSTLYEIEKVYDNDIIDPNNKKIAKDYLARQYMNCVAELKRYEKYSLDKNLLKRNIFKSSTKLKKILLNVNYRLYNALK